MDNKEKRAARRQALVNYVTGKGFYKVVGLSLVAVVLAAWFISTGVRHRGTDLTASTPAASAPTAVSKPSSPTGSTGLSEQLIQTPSTAPAAVNSARLDGEPADTEPEDGDPAETTLFVMPLAGEIVTGYSDSQPTYSPTFHDWRVHAAVDIAGEIGTPVRAVSAGTVTAVESDLMWGTTVIITHADGYQSKYCNLGAQPTVGLNAAVEVGQVIGSVGKTAQAEIGQEPHLHFVLYRDGEPVDPQTVMAALTSEDE